MKSVDQSITEEFPDAMARVRLRRLMLRLDEITEAAEAIRLDLAAELNKHTPENVTVNANRSHPDDDREGMGPS